MGSEAWTAGLNFTVTNPWHQWIAIDDQADGGNVHKAGYAITYDKFQFITINGAGHMVRLAWLLTFAPFKILFPYTFVCINVYLSSDYLISIIIITIIMNHSRSQNSNLTSL